MNKTISVKLEYDGKKYNKKAVLQEVLSGYYISEKVNHDGIEIYEGDELDRGLWSVSIQLDESYIIELFFVYDCEDYKKTFDFSHALIWDEDGLILDEVTPDVMVTNRYRRY